MANGTLKVQNIETSSGSGTITLGQSGETIALGSDVTSKLNQPAFMATMGTSNQNITDQTTTKVQLTNEVIDTDNAFDPTTNYRFTVPSGKAGKYLVNGSLTIRSSSTSTITLGYSFLYLNGSEHFVNIHQAGNNPLTSVTLQFSTLIDLAVDDYLELFGYIDVSSGTPAFDPGVTGDATKSTYFSAFRIGAE